MPRIHRALFAALAIGACAPLSAPRTASAAPEPSVIPLRWQLDLEPGPLRIAILDVPGIGPRAYYYLTYTVENNSGQDMYFAPSFELATDDGELLRSGRDVPNEVNRILLDRLKNPELLDQTDAIGTLRQGPQNAREGLVVWPATSMKVDRINVYCMGFSGETKRVQKPAPTTPQGAESESRAPANAAPAKGDKPGATDENEVVLRKTLMLVHATPGELTNAEHRPLERVSSRWILR